MASHEVCLTRTRVAFLACVSVCLLGAFAPPAHATHLLVEPGNPAAYQTINAALLVQSASLGAIETVYVAPGVYPETLSLGDIYGASPCLLGSAGAEQTVVRNARLGASDPAFAIEGIWFLEKIGELFVSPEQSMRPPIFRHCIFGRGAVFSAYSCMWPNLFDCTFRGDTELLEYTTQGRSPFSGLRFERCRLSIMPRCGDMHLVNCSFVGPIDTALVVRCSSGNPIHLQGAHFDSCSVAVFQDRACENITLDECSFSDCETGFALPDVEDPSYPVHVLMSSSSFLRGETAVASRTPCRVTLEDMQVHGAMGPPIDVDVVEAHLIQVTVTAATEPLRLNAVNCNRSQHAWPFSGIQVSRSRFSNNRLGSVVIDQDSSVHATGRIEVSNSVFEHNGAGVRVDAQAVTIANNVLSENGGMASFFANAQTRQQTASLQIPVCFPETGALPLSRTQGHLFSQFSSSEM